MKLAISNIALPAYEHTSFFSKIREMGVKGLEVAPSRVWINTWESLTSRQVSEYRQSIENSGLKVVGLHSLFFDRPELGLFRSSDITQKTLDFLIHLSKVCRDLGGKTLIFGSPAARRRNNIPIAQAEAIAVDFFGTLCNKIVAHGTCICLEPLTTNESDFINSVTDSHRIATIIDHPAFKIQIDAKALTDAQEVNSETFNKISSKLVHCHINEPGLGLLGAGIVNHQQIANLLYSINYLEFVSLEQRMLDCANPLEALKLSVSLMKRIYLNESN
ncbi:TIM barrel protein [Cylindrospermopsis raciborskii CHAB3438]|uniref:sugar phosphate isomerase/epimerase family protein n=1 Tax=Cylindrospermopsis raciborskii TaxID=77022 RepID=UPI001F103FDE|nr:sugar phosphate isomerase/epimerase family protein [Cylindrospermopsis raciborskii]MCH4903861.1 TIM barrel protein [Cylindrospermopsis raciborskii CHAB3438]